MNMHPPFDHILITRFNVPTLGRESLIRAREGWLRQRVDLFETYCLPSVSHQTIKNFQWLIYFDPESPPWLKDWVRQHESRHSFIPLFRESISRRELVSDLHSLIDETSEVLVTTNLDNDDALATDFIARVQHAIHGASRTAIYLEHGVILQDENLYLRRDNTNAFCSVAESWDKPVTAWADWHNRLGRSMPVTVVDGPPAWLQVIHDSNVSNVVHGTLSRPRLFNSRFPHVLAGLPEPRTHVLLGDAILWRPIRGTKAVMRQLAKTIAIQLFGRDGFDRLKNRVAELISRRQQSAGPRSKSPATADQRLKAEK